MLTGEQTSHRHDTEEGAGDERGEHHKGAGGHHVLEGRARGDGDAPLVVGAFGRALVQQARVLRQRQRNNRERKGYTRYTRYTTCMSKNKMKYNTSTYVFLHFYKKKTAARSKVSSKLSSLQAGCFASTRE